MKELNIDKIQSDPTLSFCLDNFFGYASHAIQDKAIPNFFDGQLPTQRRYLLAMQDLKAFPGRKTIKSTVAGARMTGWYSPQGNGYNVLVNMSQDYKVPVLLTDPEGNWGEQENFIPAAERYTETKLSKFAMETLLHDLPNERVSSGSKSHGIVPTKTNWEGSLLEEEYLPARVPILLINGSAGIAVGIAQTFQPLEYKSLLIELKSFINTGSVNYSNLQPGHSTNCLCISTREEFEHALKTGSGSIRLAARFQTEGRKDRTKSIIITAVPPYTSFNAVGDKFNDWRRNDNRCPFKSYSNESSNESIRLVFEFKPKCYPKTSTEVQLFVQQLYKKLSLTTTASIKMIALKGKYPIQYNVQDFFKDWVQERSNIIQRISQKKADHYEREKHKYDLLKWVKKELNDIIPILKKESSEHSIESKINILRLSTKEKVIESKDLKILLGINLRQISKISEEELNLQSKLSTKKWKTYVHLVENEKSRRTQILSDINYFIDNSKKLGVRETKTEFEESKSIFLNSSIRDIKKTIIKPVNPFIDYLNRELTTDVLVQSEAGFFVRIPTRSVKTQKTTPKLALASDNIQHVTFIDQEYIFFITDTGKLFKILKDGFPLNMPIHWGRVLELAKMNSTGIKSIHMVPVITNNPTHLMVYFTDNSFKKIRMSKINSFRVSIVLPFPIKYTGLIGQDRIPLFREGKISYLDPGEIKEASVKRSSRFPKLLMLGMPTRILNKMGIGHEEKSIFKTYE